MGENGNRIHILGGSKQKNISHDQAVDIACKVGQQVYDQLRAEHAQAMGELQQDLRNHFREIKEVTAANILDLQRRSFSYRIRRDFGVDCTRIAESLRGFREAALVRVGLREAPLVVVEMIEKPVSNETEMEAPQIAGEMAVVEGGEHDG
jgi:hypothetical protein